MREIPLTKGKVALVDDADFDRLSYFRWCAHLCNGLWYATRTAVELGKNRTVRMHVEVLPGQKRVDHEDGNTLNNQRRNLRPATARQNAFNRRGHCDSKSGLKGVIKFPNRQKWRGQIFFRGRQRHLGCFNSPSEAARAYDEAAKKYFGKFAKLNFTSI